MERYDLETSSIGMSVYNRKVKEDVLEEVIVELSWCGEEQGAACSKGLW